MAMQHRRGLKRDMKPEKLRPGELAIPLDAKEVWACFSPGVAEKMTTYENMKEHIQEAEGDIVENLTAGMKAEVETAIKNTQMATTSMQTQVNTSISSMQGKINIAITNANTATSTANTATENAKTATTQANEEAENSKVVNAKSQELYNRLKDISVASLDQKLENHKTDADKLYLQKTENAASATKLNTSRKISGIEFDGSQDIDLPVATSETSGLMSKDDKVKLNKIPDDTQERINERKWKTYSKIADIGLKTPITWDQIIVALIPKAPATITFPAWRYDYESMGIPGPGQRHIFEVSVSGAGYVKLSDFDVDNGVTYTCGHNGTKYSPWTPAK